MMTQVKSINGLWKGHFSYFASQDIGQWPFKMRISVRDDTICGLVIEPDVTGLGEVKSKIEGKLAGAEVRFTKHYEESAVNYTRAVQYEGRLESDGATIAGTWKHSENSGPFEMTLIK